MAFPTTPILSDFNQANGTLVSPWAGPLYPSEPLGSVVSNQAVGPLSGSWNSAYLSDRSFSGSVEIYCTVPVVTTYVDLYFFSANEGLASIRTYYVQISTAGGSMSVRRVDNSTTDVLLETYAATIASGCAFGVQCINGLMRGWFKPAAGSWGAMGTGVTDTTYTSGHLGFDIGNASPVTAIDDFGGGQVIVPSRSYTRQARVRAAVR